jgi:hypothetical protein
MPTFSATQDKPGTYLIRCRVNNGQSYTIGVAFTTNALALRKIAAEETREFDAQKGWAKAINAIIDATESVGAASLTGVVLTNGTAPFEADQSMGGHKLTGLSAGTEDTDAATYAQVVEAALSSGALYGFPNLKEDSTISFDDVSRNFTIAPTGSTFTVYSGIRYDLTAKSRVITNVTGYHWLYFNSSGILSEAVNPDEDLQKTLYTQTGLVAVVYWNASSSARLSMCDKRHGTSMDGASRLQWKNTVGAKYVSGFDLGDISADEDGTLDSHARLSVSSGVISDGDLEHSISAKSANTPWPFFYRGGSPGNWLRVIPATNAPIFTFEISPGLDFVGYNVVSEIAISTVSPISNKRTMTHIFATSDPDQPIIAVMGRSEDVRIAEVYANARQEVTDILADIPFSECVPIASVSYYCSNGFDNDVKAVIASLLNDGATTYIDWRTDTNEESIFVKTGDNVKLRFPGDTLKIDQYPFSGVLEHAFILNGYGDIPAITFMIDDVFYASLEIGYTMGDDMVKEGIAQLYMTTYGETYQVPMAVFSEDYTSFGSGNKAHKVIIDGDNYSSIHYYINNVYKFISEFNTDRNSFVMRDTYSNYFWMTSDRFVLSNDGYYGNCVGLKTAQAFEETGTYVVDSFVPYHPVGGCKWFYVAALDNGATEAVRTGEIHVAYNMTDGVLVQAEVAGADLGTTTDVAFTTAINGTSIELRATNAIGAWRISTFLTNMDNGRG